MEVTSAIKEIALDKYTLEYLKPLQELPGEFLFGDNEPLGISSIQRVFVIAIKQCNLSLKAKKEEEIPVIRIHDLRHSHASYLIGLGANVVAISKRLGHSDVNMTLKVYTHLLKESEVKVLSILDAI